jgi:hypothetical protein
LENRNGRKKGLTMEVKGEEGSIEDWSIGRKGPDE